MRSGPEQPPVLGADHEDKSVDDRIMSMVSLIADQVQTTQELFSDEGKIMASLMSSGYRLHEADAALTLMQTLVQDGAGGPKASSPGDRGAMRSMSTEERARFSIEAFSVVMKLARLGIITADQREDIVEKALSLHRGRIGIGEVQTLLSLNLFAEALEPEEFLSSAHDRSTTAWN